MAVVLQAFGSSVNGTGNVNVSWPTHVTNDIGILVLESVSATWTTPSGWTLVDTSSIAATELNIYWKRATSSSEPAVFLAFPAGADHVAARIFTFRGCVTTGSPVLTTATSTKTTSSASWSAPSITTTTANEFVIYGVSRDNDSSNTSTFSDPTNANLISPTEIVESGTALGNGGGFVLGYGVKTTAGATGSTTGTLLVAASNASITFSLAQSTVSQLDAIVGTFALNGVTVGLLFSGKLVQQVGTFSVNGNNAILSQNKILDTSVGTFTIAGVPVDLTYISTGPTFTLNQQTGIFTVAGSTVNLNKQVLLDLQVGTYALSGNTLGFIQTLALHSVPGSFSVSGKDAVFSLTKRFSLTTGTYNVSGNNADVVRFYQLNNQPGTYQVVGSGLDYFSDRNLVTLPLSIVADFRSVGNFFWYQTTQTIQPVKYKITKRNEFILGRQTHMGRRGL